MTGRALIIGLLAFSVIFGAALWWFQTRAFYEEMTAEQFAAITPGLDVIEWQGIDASTSPLKLRACFRVTPEAAERYADENDEIQNATPLVAPSWFDCFDAQAIGRDLEAGPAEGYYIGPSDFDGVDLYMALYPGGRGYVWRQLNEKYSEQ